MKIIFLILSGADDIVSADRVALYKSLYSLSRLYYEKMKKTYDFEYFYVEYKENLLNEVEEKDDFMYIKGKEEFKKIYDKTNKALNYINKKYAYDYLVRTNISSFWNIHNLYKMAATFPTEKCLTGVYICNHFITGTGIIMSNDVCMTLAAQPLNPNIQCDDVFISETLKKIYKIHDLDEKLMCYLVSGENNSIPANIDDILYFRIKNNPQTEEDTRLFKILLSEIYKIT